MQPSPVSAPPESEPMEPLLAFFKALADANRLRIVGLLAQRPHSVEELADVLSLRASTVSHHLGKLGGVGLVAGRADGHHHVYALDAAALEGMARQLLAPGELPRLGGHTADGYDNKVLATFLGPDGRLTALPMQRKKFAAILRHVGRSFASGRTYTGKEVDDALRVFSDDVASLRRGLIDHRMMARDPDGSRYWVLDPAQ